MSYNYGGGFTNRGGPNDGFNQHRGGGGGGYDNGGSRGFGGGRGGGDRGGIIYKYHFKKIWLF